MPEHLCSEAGISPRKTGEQEEETCSYVSPILRGRLKSGADRRPSLLSDPWSTADSTGYMKCTWSLSMEIRPAERRKVGVIKDDSRLSELPPTLPHSRSD